MSIGGTWKDDCPHLVECETLFECDEKGEQGRSVAKLAARLTRRGDARNTATPEATPMNEAKTYDERRARLVATMLDVAETLRALAGTGVPSALEACAALSHELTMLTNALGELRRAEREGR